MTVHSANWQLDFKLDNGSQLHQISSSGIAYKNTLMKTNMISSSDTFFNAPLAVAVIDSMTVLYHAGKRSLKKITFSLLWSPITNY
jgi:hypothetical protein